MSLVVVSWEGGRRKEEEGDNGRRQSRSVGGGMPGAHAQYLELSEQPPLAPAPHRAGPEPGT